MKAFFLNWYLNHKVKTLGCLAMTWGFAQVNFEQIRELIPEKYRGVTLFAFGMLATIFGFLSKQNAIVTQATVVQTIPVDPPIPPPSS